MTNREIRVTIIYMLIVGLIAFALGREIGVGQQQAINNNLYTIIEKKDKSYDELMQQTIEYRWLYESCQTMFGDYQDKVEAGCYVNGGWNCE